MPLLADRVLESTTTTGTGTFALGGALTGYRTFNSTFSNSDVVYYTADNGSGEWEVGYGTVGTGTLSRDTVLESSNANALVVFTTGEKKVFCTAPAVGIYNASTGGTVSGPLTVTGTTTLATSLTGLLKASSGVVATASAGTDYVAVGGALGTPSSGTLTSCTGLPISTGVSGLGTGVATFLATPSSANLAAAVTDETGSGALVFGTSPALNNPAITNYTETTYNLSGTGISTTNGTIQYKTVSGNTTFTESLSDGQSVTLMLNPGVYTITWPTATWIGSTASSAPTLTASVYNCITFFQLNGVLYGKYEGRV